MPRSEEHTSELQSRREIVCRLLLENTTPATAIYTLSLHDALPISGQPCERILPAEHGEHPISGLEQLDADGMALGLIAVDQRLVCESAFDEREFPTEVVAVLDAEIGRAHV